MSAPVPPAPEPDDKNWTWVLERACPECGFDPAAHPREQIGAAVRAMAPRYAAHLQHPEVRTRPAPQVWSALEYGAHVRDVFVLFDQRLALMLAEDDPTFANWDQDVTALEQRYDLQDPHAVATALVAAASVLADRYDTVAGDQWTRRGIRSDGSIFTVETFGTYLLHDPLHHLWDIDEGYRNLGAAS